MTGEPTGPVSAEPTPDEAIEHLRHKVDRVLDSDAITVDKTYIRALLAELERLHGIEKRADETSTWCGLDGMHRAITYIRTGWTP